MKRTFLGNVSSLFMVMAVILGAITIPALAAVSTGTVTRAYSTSTPALGATFNVTLTPSGAAIAQFYQVAETLPAGFVFVSSNADNENTTALPVVTFTRLGNTPIIYTVAAPATAGTATFSGTFKDTNRDDGTVTGQAQVNVGATPTPTPTATPASGAPGTVSGTVTNATTNAPIVGAIVSIGGRTTTTDANGAYTITIAPGTYTVTIIAPGSAATTATVTVTSGGAVTQNAALQPAVVPTVACFGVVCKISPNLRIIDENTAEGQVALAAGPSWNAQSFQGFWYDLDDGLFSETLRIPQTTLGDESNGKTRTIRDRDDPAGAGLVYETVRQLKLFELVKNNKGKVENGLDVNGNKVKTGATHYAKLGWMAEEFVAVNGKAKKLSKLLIEQKEAASEKKTLTVGESWQIGDWTLTANSIDAKASPRQVWLTLSYKGQKVDDKVIGQGDVYTYIEKSIAGESDVPLFVTFVDSIFAGATTDMAQLRFTWAVSRDVTEIKSDDKIGVFKVKTAAEDKLTLENDATVDLSRDSTVTLARNFVFRVADDKPDAAGKGHLRFMPDIVYTQPGTYIDRGFVLDEQTQDLSNLLPFQWDAQSYKGFWYDLDDGLKSETLTILQTTLGDESTGGKTRTIRDRDDPAGAGLIYETQRQLKQFELVKNNKGKVENGLDVNGNKVKTDATHYGKLGWMAEEFVAVNGKAKKLSKLLIEQKEAASEKKTLTVGESWQIGDWTLTANSIDAKASPRQVWLTLSYKGQKLDDKVIGQGQVYTYIEKSIAGESDVPLFVTFVDSIFAGATTDMAQLRFTWAVSRDVTEVKSDDKIGVFKVKTAAEDKLTLENDATVDLSRDSTVNLARNFNFKVADDKPDAAGKGHLRFYPMVERTIGAEGVQITSTATVVGTTMAPTPTGTGKPVTNATATPTAVATTAPPTATGTAKPAATATPKEPGFESMLAIAGLLAVAFLVLRQRK